SGGRGRAWCPRPASAAASRAVAGGPAWRGSARGRSAPPRERVRRSWGPMVDARRHIRRVRSATTLGAPPHISLPSCLGLPPVAEARMQRSEGVRRRLLALAAVVLPLLTSCPPDLSRDPAFAPDNRYG